ncbi:MAG: carbohydrate-binding domain-containing protein [Clostridiales bacterium]|nr:carbohydrate-binding domain-containing protein [Clostridiales bacterium]
MKRIIPYFMALSLLLAGCYSVQPKENVQSEENIQPESVSPSPAANSGAVDIVLSDNGVTVDGEAAGGDVSKAVYLANDIVYYEADRDFTYGEGTEKDEHSASEAASHTVVHITQPGTYRLSGTLSPGQIAVDLGEDAEDDPNAVVTLILDGANINCTVAPALIFYNVYECGDTDDPRMDVDTSGAGANVIIADGSVNNISGSYVARIYKSVELSEDGTEVVDSKKLHKYDAAFYSKMSMNVAGGETGNGLLNINAENEGLDSELHLTINGGNINIISGNDGINTNEDEVSVTTINGGNLHIQVTGSTGEGDGIDSNGWLVINGGSVFAEACASSADSGLDSEMGVYINGGSVLATGNMLDPIDGSQTYAAFSFAGQQTGGTYTLKNAEGQEVMSWTPSSSYSNMVISAPELVPGTYTLWRDGVQLSGAKTEGGMMGGGFGGMRPISPQDGEDGAAPEGGKMDKAPDDFRIAPPEHADGSREMAPPEGFEDGIAIPEGGKPDFGGRREENFSSAESSTEFVISEGANFFGQVAPADGE